MHVRLQTNEMENSHTGSIASSLVREYLSRSGLKLTLQVMDEEMPREENAISNRQLLVKELHLGKLMKNNKGLTVPLRTILEVITQHLMDKSNSSPRILTEKQQSTIDSNDTTLSSQPTVYNHLIMRNSTENDLKTTQCNHQKTSYNNLPQGAVLNHAVLQDNDMQFSNNKSQESLRDPVEIRPATELVTCTKPTLQFKPDKDQMHRYSQPCEQQRQDTQQRNVTLVSSGSDLIIDDDVESNSMLGGGKSSLITQRYTDEELLSTGVSNLQGQRIKALAKPRPLGIAGPMTSNADAKDCRWTHKPKSYPNMCGTFDIPYVYDLSSDKSTVSSADSNANEYIPSQVSPSSPASSSRDRTVLKNHTRPYEQTNVSDVLELELNLYTNTSSFNHSKPLPFEKYEIPPQYTRVGSEDREVLGYSAEMSSIAGGHQPVLKSGIKESSPAISDSSDITQCIPPPDTSDRLSNREMHFQEQSLIQELKQKWESKPIDLQTAVSLRNVIFGDVSRTFNDVWWYQSFTFCDLPTLKYGIVQRKAGPCGILAAVQTVLLQELLFGEKKIPSNRWFDPLPQERCECLAQALTRILWKAGEGIIATVALPGNDVHFHGGAKCKADDLLETLDLYRFTNHDDLLEFIHLNISQFERDGSCGVILALYSAILSRTIPKLKTDMDEPRGHLMGVHDWCSQDMVNLFLAGRAVSNVFNDVMELNGAYQGQKAVILKGLTSRNDIGFMSLFEHYGTCQVGTYLKTPRYPIWLVCSQGHFTVLFSVCKELVSDWKAERRFHLYYYDGLAKQDHEIKLSINTTNRFYTPPEDDEQVPPIEHCIRTKWHDAQVDWNGTEPIF